jgi:hypothetical protein
LIFYLEAFDGLFGIFFRSKEPQNMEEARATTIKLERQFLAAYGFLLIHDFQPSVATGVQEVLDIEDECYPPSCTRMDLQLSRQRLNKDLFKFRVHKSS